MIVDPLIKLFSRRKDTLEMLGRVWELLYIEGNAPDIGKRRENFIKLILKYEFGLEVKSAPDTERSWDFKINIEGRWYTYSLKTTERLTTLKVAWDGFPSWERAETFSFDYPMLYVIGDRLAKRINVYVFTKSVIKRVRNNMGRNFWWIPKSGTNPRGFGISTKAVRQLIEEARKEGNHIGIKYTPIRDLNKATEDYWKGWYFLLKKLAGFID